MKTFQLLAELIKRAVFLAPDQEMEDVTARDVAAGLGVELIIRDDEGGEDRPVNEPPQPQTGSNLLGPDKGSGGRGVPHWRANLFGLPPGSTEPPPRNPAGPDPDTLSPDEE